VIFFSDDDRSFFLKCLGDARIERQCEVHAFVLMPNHVHLLATAREPMAISRMMQDVGRTYVKYINSRYERTGALYEGRFKSSVVETSRYFLACMRYIELNPVRAQIVSVPAQFPWSSFSENVSGEPTGLLTPHPEYLSLGINPEERSKAYVRLFEDVIEERDLNAIRQSARQGCALGGELFCEAIEATLRRSVGFMPQGRPAGRT
jgi:putative transposase